mmetsp:Transcript_240/g.617  ORF Transcript_240/g.617 Transcript_240/m.617 type:complete len:268 (+) Transcript_240:36-839(+)
MQFVLTFLGSRRADGQMGGAQAVGEEFTVAQRKPNHDSINVRLCRIPVLYPPGSAFVAGVLVGILQYAIVMVAVLVADILIWSLKLDSIAKVPFFIKGVSCAWAMYNLVFFYYEARQCPTLKERLEQIHAENKFLAVKMIIFFTFFQQVLLGTVLNDWLHFFDQFAGLADLSGKQVAEGAQSFLLCVEMFFFSLWHVQAYPVDEFNKLDAAASLSAAISKESRVDLKNAVTEAIAAGLEDLGSTEKQADEWRRLLDLAREMLDHKFP